MTQIPTQVVKHVVHNKLHLRPLLSATVQFIYTQQLMQALLETLVVEDRIKIIKGHPLQSTTYMQRGRRRTSNNAGYTMKGNMICVVYTILVVC